MDKELEQGRKFTPKYDANGLIAAIITDAADGAVLMLGYMNEEALGKTRETGIVHFYSRSRQKLWKKGETSGHILNLKDMRIDCDQDAVWVIAEPAGPTCHTGERSCFYRRMTDEGLERV